MAKESAGLLHGDVDLAPPPLQGRLVVPVVEVDAGPLDGSPTVLHDPPPVPWAVHPGPKGKHTGVCRDCTIDPLPPEQEEPVRYAPGLLQRLP